MPAMHEMELLLAIWRKALANLPNPTSLKFSTRSNALNVRMKLYSIIKPYRDGELQNETLELAAQKLYIRLETVEGKPGIIFLEKTLVEDLNAAIESLGIELGEDTPAAEESEAEASLRRFLEAQSGPKSQTPFYER